MFSFSVLLFQVEVKGQLSDSSLDTLFLTNCPVPLPTRPPEPVIVFDIQGYRLNPFHPIFLTAHFRYGLEIRIVPFAAEEPVTHKRSFSRVPA